MYVLILLKNDLDIPINRNVGHSMMELIRDGVEIDFIFEEPIEILIHLFSKVHLRCLEEQCNYKKGHHKKGQLDIPWAINNSYHIYSISIYSHSVQN